MAEEVNEETAEEAAAEEKKSGGKIGLILIAVALLVAVGGGLSIYFFVIAPRLAPPIDEDMFAIDGPEEYIPEFPQFVYFESSFVHLMREGNGPAAILLYKVTFECENEATVFEIETHRARFIDMLLKLHGSRTREEVDDILIFEKSIQSQILQRANDILKRISQDSDGASPKITAIFHEQLHAQDPAV
ncbi:MAG: hypothetical protein VCD00_16015 [Candidatus Hydrogenedentota bacterium]